MQYSKIDFIERSLVTYNWSGIDKFGQHNYIYFLHIWLLFNKPLLCCFCHGIYYDFI